MTSPLKKKNILAINTVNNAIESQKKKKMLNTYLCHTDETVIFFVV